MTIKHNIIKLLFVYVMTIILNSDSIISCEFVTTIGILCLIVSVMDPQISPEND